MPALVEIRYPLNEWQQLALEEAAAGFPDLWRMRVEAAGREQPGGFRVYVDGPDATTSRPFDVEAAPVEIGTYLQIVRRQLIR